MSEHRSWNQLFPLGHLTWEKCVRAISGRCTICLCAALHFSHAWLIVVSGRWSRSTSLGERAVQHKSKLCTSLKWPGRIFPRSSNTIETADSNCAVLKPPELGATARAPRRSLACIRCTSPAFLSVGGFGAITSVFDLNCVSKFN